MAAARESISQYESDLSSKHGTRTAGGPTPAGGGKKKKDPKISVSETRGYYDEERKDAINLDSDRDL